MSRVIDLTGKRFGKLVVTSRAVSKSYGQTAWQCRCDCGRELVVRGIELRGGTTKSCGCIFQRMHEWNGVTVTTRQLALLAGVNTGTMRARIDLGYSIEEAIAGRRAIAKPRGRHA